MVDCILCLFRKTRSRINDLNVTYLSVTILLLFTILAFTSYNKTTAFGDLAEFLNNPVRLINGDLPYRDFWLLFPPGEVYLPFFLYKIFGLNINVILAFLSVISALTGLLSFFVGRSIFKENFFSIIACFLIYFYTSSGFIYFFFLLISLLFFLRYLNLDKKDGTKTLFFTGIFIGIAFMFRFYLVSSMLLAVLCTLLIQSHFNQESAGYTIKSIWILFCGILVIFGITFFSLIEIWQPMVKGVVTESISHGTQMNLPYWGLFSNLLRSSVVNLKEAMATGSIYFIVKAICHSLNVQNSLIMYLLPFIITSISVYHLVGRNLEKSEKVLVSFFLLWWLFTFPKALGRSDIQHLIHSILPLFFLLIFFLKKSLQLNYNATFAKYSVLIITFLLITTIPLSMSDKVNGIKARSYFEVVASHGKLLVANKSIAKDINNTINFINKNTKEGDYIFVTPWSAPPFYALTNTKNPTYYDSLIDVIIRPSDEKQKNICADLLDKDTKLIIHYSDWGFDGKKEFQFLNACPVLHKCIEDNFQFKKKYGIWRIYAQE